MKNKTKNIRAWLRKADAAWGKHVHRSECCIIGVGCSGRLEAHHLISRAVRATRHAPENGVLLCSLHHKFSPHLSPHGAPLQFAEWLQKNHAEKWKWVQEHKNDWKKGKPDYEDICKKLKGLLAGN